MLSKRIYRECWMSLAKSVRTALAVAIIGVALVWLIMFPKTGGVLHPDFVASVALGLGLIVTALLVFFMTKSRAVPIVLSILLLWSVLCNICLCALVRNLHQLSLGLLEAERLSARRNLRILESGEQGSIERLAELLRRVAGEERANQPTSDDSTETDVRAIQYTGFDEEIAGPGGVELSIAVSTEEKGPVLVFIAKNNANKEFVTTGLREGHNRIAIFLPGGRHAGDDSEWHDKAARVVIAPSQSKEWRLDAHHLLRHFKEQGLYRIRWKVGKLESQDLLLLKSVAVVGPGHSGRNVMSPAEAQRRVDELKRKTLVRVDQATRERIGKLIDDFGREYEYVEVNGNRYAVSSVASWDLRKIGEGAVPYLIEAATTHSNVHVRQYALAATYSIFKGQDERLMEYLPVFVHTMRDTDADARGTAVAQIAKMARRLHFFKHEDELEQIIPYLQEALGDSANKVQAIACEELYAVGRKHLIPEELIEKHRIGTESY